MKKLINGMDKSTLEQIAKEAMASCIKTLDQWKAFTAGMSKEEIDKLIPHVKGDLLLDIIFLTDDLK